MNQYRFLTLLALAAPTLAQAASVSALITACKAQADSKKLFELIAKNDAAALDKFKTAKSATGDCSALAKGMTVAIDKKDGQFFCVRPTGGLDCLWTAAGAINENPSSQSDMAPPSQSGGHGGRGGGRGGGQQMQP